MAENFFVTTCVGIQKSKIHLPHDSSVEYLKGKINEIFKVEKSDQKLIWKGKVLSNDEVSLSSLKVKKGDQIMVLLNQNHVEKNALLSSIAQFFEQFQEEEQKAKFLQSFIRESEESAVSLDSLVFCKKELLLSNEKLMKLLESIDSLEITVPSDEVRSKRRSLVKDIQRLMDSIDKDCEELTSKGVSS